MLNCCGTLVHRDATYSFHVENKCSNTINLIGLRCHDSTTTKNDTLIDTSITPNKSLLLLSGWLLVPPPFGDVPYYKSINIEECDSVFIFENDKLIKKYWNYHKKEESVFDSSTLIFQFEDLDVYAPSDTILFETEGPQPKEIFFTYTIE